MSEATLEKVLVRIVDLIRSDKELRDAIVGYIKAVTTYKYWEVERVRLKVERLRSESKERDKE